MLLGTVAVAAGSPATARRLSTSSVTLDELYFYWAHLRWQAVGLAVMLGVSLLSRDNARRLGILVAAGALAALFLVPLIGSEVNGARRWLDLGMRFQPSEFLKPGFAIALAWIFSWRVRDPNLPTVWIASGVMVLVAALLMLQPNFGDTLLFGAVWFTLVVLAGISLKRLSVLAGLGALGMAATYFLYDNA
ncbi:MAG: FtsW/RodA/SpoVE family cell cycle protein, partial [Sphingomonadaceae bacterium]|nr:FtsW/RodA/SpoVE family cell cycle protein [Sphingomonadaceae bacterium]